MLELNTDYVLYGYGLVRTHQLVTLNVNGKNRQYYEVLPYHLLTTGYPISGYILRATRELYHVPKDVRRSKTTTFGNFDPRPVRLKQIRDHFIAQMEYNRVRRRHVVPHLIESTKNAVIEFVQLEKALRALEKDKELDKYIQTLPSPTKLDLYSRRGRISYVAISERRIK